MALKNSMGGMISQVSRMLSGPGEDLPNQVGELSRWQFL
jgi:hypothetical protein